MVNCLTALPTKELARPRPNRRLLHLYPYLPPGKGAPLGLEQYGVLQHPERQRPADKGELGLAGERVERLVVYVDVRRRKPVRGDRDGRLREGQRLRQGVAEDQRLPALGAWDDPPGIRLAL